LLNVNRKRPAFQIAVAFQLCVIAGFLFAITAPLSPFNDSPPFDHNRLAALGDYTLAFPVGKNPKPYEAQKAEALLIMQALEPGWRDPNISLLSPVKTMMRSHSVVASFLIRSPPYSVVRL
jgi:hypothetical protein